jgi:hypothetical protein
MSWFNWFKKPDAGTLFKNTQENTMKAFIRPVGDKTGLFYSDGRLITTYARTRDASRGAARRGLTVIGVN